MSGHTPGPWEARIKDACFVHRPADPHFPIYVPGDDETRAADAHLIAAAPEMLEALNEAITNGKWSEGEQCGDWCISKEVYEMLRDAIAKAESNT